MLRWEVEIIDSLEWDEEDGEVGNNVRDLESVIVGPVVDACATWFWVSKMSERSSSPRETYYARPQSQDLCKGVH